MLGDGSKAVKVHHLVKAPENTPGSVRKRESWDASEPATVYKTPEILPDGTHCTAATVTTNRDSRGIVICGTGIGMSIVVNRFPGIRGTLCSDLYTAKLCREHNDSNILIMGGRVVGHGLAREIVKVWLSTPFEGGRHQKRLDKINQFDESNKI